MFSDLPIFPETFRAAILRFFARAGGIILFIISISAIWNILSATKDLSTWTNFSTLESAGLFTKIIDLFVYAIGGVPVLFISIIMLRPAFFLIMGWRRPNPEITSMQIFVAVMLLSGGLAFIVANYGGIFGNFIVSDIGPLIGEWGGVLLGTIFLTLCFFITMGALGLTPNKVMGFFFSVGSLILRPFEKGTKYNLQSTEHRVRSKKKKVKRKKRIQNSESRRYDEAELEEMEYELPPPELLEKSSFASNVVTREHREIAQSMELNFNKYGIFGTVREIHPGPIVTRYDFEPEDGQKINKIMETANDMRRAMATEQIRIALVPRTRYIGVEMVNPNRQFVYFQSLVNNDDFIESKMAIPLALGVEISGRPFYADLAKMPHVLIAGRTGSGKSVFVQSIITSIVYHSRPDEVKMVIVDPKGVDFNKWKDIPHLITPIVTEAVSAVNVLKWAVREMEDRYKHLKMVEAQNISDYNSMVEKLSAKGKTIKRKVPAGTNDFGEIEYEVEEVQLEKMPYVVLIMDEIADLMQQARKEVEACVQRITQKARAAGIHLVAATQRPDTSVITGVIKSNLPTRISFQARSYIDSMTTLGERGAEMLLSQGDMLYSESGKPPIRIHGAFIQDREIDKIARFLRSQCTPDYVDGITDSADDFGNAAIGLPPSLDEKNGDLYNQAVEIVCRDKKPTVSYVQRRLGIGYNKAATIIEKMEANGIIVKMPSGKYEVA